MSDFRKRLYGRYLSGFQADQIEARQSRLKTYFRWLDHKLGSVLSVVPRGAAVLEIGCGAGDILEYLGSRGFMNVEGVDHSAEQVDAARQRGLNARLADASEYLASRKGGLGLVIAFDVIEHFTKDELLDLFDALHSALKPGGTLILQTPNGEGMFARSIIYGDLTHTTVFTSLSLRQILTATGFTDARFIECGPAAMNLKGIIKTALWQLVRLRANLCRFIELGTTQKIWTSNMICVAKNGPSGEGGSSDARGD